MEIVQLDVRPVVTELRVVGGQVVEIATYPSTEVQVIQAASPAPGSEGSIQPFEMIVPIPSPLQEWVVNHNMGRYPVAVNVLSPTLAEVDADVQHVSVNQTRVRFASPQSGRVRIF